MFGSFLAKKLFALDNSTSRKLKSRRKTLARLKSRKATFESLEDRRLLAGFVPGSIQGQEGWSGGNIPISLSVDQAVDQSGTNAHSGVGSWHISNQAYNGNFSGWPFGPGLTASAGQPSSGAPADLFTATYYFKSANTVADGSNIEMDLGTVPGDDRNTFLAVTNDTNANGGLKLRMAEPDGVTGDFFATQIVATGLTRNAWHRIDITAKFYNGDGNDTFEVKLDGVSMINPNAASPNFNTTIFNTFEGFRDGNALPYAISNRLFFRSGAAASGFDPSFTDAGAQGFYFDDMTYQAALQSSPSTSLAIYAAGFEAQPSIVYVDDSWVGTISGTDPDGAGPATSFGFDSFATINGGVAAVANGGIVQVYAGTYNELVAVDKSINLLGAQAGVDARTRVVPVSQESVVSNGDGDFQILADNVTIDGFTLTGVTNNPSSPPFTGLGAAIWTNPGFSGTQGGHQIRNNIIQGNISGIELDNDGTFQTKVQYNLIRNNNAPGAGSGNGIEVNFGLANAVIDSNTFINNPNGSVSVFVGGPSVDVTNNVADAQIYLASVTGGNISGNAITNSSSGGIVLGGGDTGLTITSNEINGVAPGFAALRLRNDGPGPNSALTITGNKFLAGATGYGVRPGAASYIGTLTLLQNQISGGSAAVQNDDAALAIDASDNYWGSSNPVAVSATILGAGAANVDFTPLIDNNESVANLAVIGFQADQSSLTVHTLGTQTGGVGRITEAYNLLTAVGTINVRAGSYTDNVDFTAGSNKGVTLAPGASPGQVTINGSLTMNANDTLAVEINGPNPATDFDNLIVTGGVSLGGATLALSGSFVPTTGSFTIIDGGTALSGTFNGLPSGTVITFNGQPLTIDYLPSPFFDVVLYTGNPVINTGAGNDTIVVRRNGSNIQVLVNSVIVLNAPIASLSSLTLNGQGGDDKLFVDYVFGGSFSLVGGITYDGGANDDAASIIGTAGQSTVYTPSATTPGTGTAVTTPGTTLFFSNIEPLDVTGMVSVTLVTPNSDDAVTVTNGLDSTTGTFDALVVSGTSNLVAFEALHAWNNGTLVIDTAANDPGGNVDSVTFASANNAHANGNIIVTMGTGTNTLNVNGVTTVAGTFSGSGLTVANLNAAINAATITGDAPLVNVDDAPSGQIQDGVDLAVAGGTVNVAAGTYAENVTVPKSLSILGPNTAIDPNTGVRVAEAVVVPGVTETSFQASTSGTIFRVGTVAGHIDVTIKGLTIDGHNAALVGGRLLNGVMVDTGAGIVNSVGSFDANPGAFDAKLIVQNNIIQNLERYGVLIDNVPARTPAAGNNVSFNKIDNLPSGNNFGGSRGRGVAFEENVYGQVSSNVMTRVNVGWQDDNYNLPSPGAGTLVSNNTIHAYHRGIFHNLQYQSATAATITGNQLFAETTGDFPASSTNFGLELSSILDNVGVTATGNNATGHVYGILLWNLQTTNTITVSGGTLSGNSYGVFATNNDPQFADGADTTVNISGVTITGSTVAGIFVDDSSASHAVIKLGISGGTSVSGGPTGLRVDGAKASLNGLTLSNTAFSGQTGDYVTLANSAMDNLIINGLTATFDGTTGGAKTVAQNYALEDKLTHAIDNATLGFIRVDAGDVYVTPNSFTSLSSPTTTTPDVQRAVDNAITGDIVHVNSGLYPNPVSVNKNLTIDGEVDGSGDPNSIISPVAGTAMTIVSPVTTMTLNDLSLVAPAGGSALLANLGSVGTVLNLINLNSSGAAGGSVSNWNTINFATNDNANTVYVTGVASSGASMSPLAGKAAQKLEVNLKLIPLGWATTANGTLNVDAKNGDDTVSASPSTTSFINLVGGPHTAGDKLNLDMSGTTPVVIVDGAGGNADSASTKTLHWSQFEQLCVYDPVLTNVVLGDFYLRGTDQADYIQFVSAAQVNPTFRVRVGNVYYPNNGGQYGPYTTSGPGASKLFVYGRGGNDTITMYNTRVDAAFFGEDGDDVITGGYGNDLLVGGQGADRISGGSVGGNDEVWGDDFNPALDNPSVASQTLSGGLDQINTYGGNDTVYGQAGNDIINTGDGADYINGGAGNDQIDGQAGDDRIYGGAGDDTISGSDGNDIVAGNDGNDTLFGRTGNDILIGGLGVDTVNGNEGSDALVGDESNGAGSKSFSKGDAADAALLALMALWGPTPTLGSLGSFNSAGPDGSTDTLWGGAAADAFFGAPPDNAADRNAPGYGPDLN